MIKLKVNKEEYSTVTAKGAVFNNEKRYFEIPTNIPIVKFQKYIPLSMEYLMVPPKEYKPFINYLFGADKIVNFKNEYKRKNCSCEICGVKTNKNIVTEVWNYNSKAKIQVFESFKTLCPNCYEFKYLFKDKLNIDFDHYNIEHFKRINNCVKKDFVEYCNEIEIVKENNLDKVWVLNLNRMYKLLGIEPLVAQRYEGQSLTKILDHIKTLALSEKKLLPDRALQKKLITYGANQKKIKNEISGDVAVRVVMLGKMMEYKNSVS